MVADISQSDFYDTNQCTSDGFKHLIHLEHNKLTEWYFLECKLNVLNNHYVIVMFDSLVLLEDHRSPNQYIRECYWKS